MADYTESITDNERADKNILYSRTVKAGKRVYFIDVKSDRKGEVYIALTESKRMKAEGQDTPAFEKHKIFLYNEDFEKFCEAFADVIDQAKSMVPALAQGEDEPIRAAAIDLDIEF